MKMLVLMSCVALSVVVCDGRVWQETLNNVTIKVKLTSGNISLSNAHNNIDISFGKLLEIAVDGDTQVGISGTFKHRFATFNYQNFKESPLEEIQVAGIDGIQGIDRNITAMRKVFTADQNLVGPAAHFSVQVVSFNNDTLVNDEQTGERFSVYNGTVRITITIGRWKFCEQDIECLRNGIKEEGGFLDMHMYMAGSQRKQSPTVTSNRGTSFRRGPRPTTYDYGGCDVTLSAKYTQNITHNKFPGRYPLVKDKETVLRFARFPHHQTVVYNFYVNVSSHEYIPTSLAFRNAPLMSFMQLFSLAVFISCMV